VGTSLAKLRGESKPIAAESAPRAIELERQVDFCEVSLEYSLRLLEVPTLGSSSTGVMPEIASAAPDTLS
jgi:hypothetical protein